MSRVSVRVWRLVLVIAAASSLVLLLARQGAAPLELGTRGQLTQGDTGDNATSAPPTAPPTAPPSTAVPAPRVSEEPVVIMTDLPSAFPWRHCLLVLAGGAVAASDCAQASEFVIEYQQHSAADEDKFLWKTTSSKCVVPVGGGLKTKAECGAEDGHWVWTGAGQLQWGRGDCGACRRCVAGRGRGAGLAMELCDSRAEEQNMELARWANTSTLAPLDTAAWQQRQDAIRSQVLGQERPLVSRALQEVDQDLALHEYDKQDPARRRRAAVFYLDRGSGGLDMVRWWIYTWRFIGLDTAEQGFDLVMLTHPASVAKLPAECSLVEEGFRLNYSAAGRCLYKPYLGVAHRDKSYDPYMNSQECLFGPGSEFLGQYSHLLRADLDTFPTPHLLGYWPGPGSVVVDREYSTNHGLENIKAALRELACSVGIEHRGWYNMGSTWYGDGRKVRHLARITVALNKYGRAHMFGPGTACRCATCHKLPKTCEWGGGPYAGTLLLYLQEIALNKLLTEDNWDRMPRGQLDQGVTDYKRSVCEPVILHCFHNAELFSKGAFSMGKYKKLDMSELNMTNERDYAAYMALVSSGQGSHSERALANLQQSLGNQTWAQYCSTRTNLRTH